MNIIAHRGYWNGNQSRQNTFIAAQAAMLRGYGIELDVRDRGGELVISHNMSDEKSPRLEDLFSLYRQLGSHVTLALNIKADGLGRALKMLLDQYEIQSYFAFDMSSAELFDYCERGIRCYARISSWEKMPPYRIEGLWVDALESSMTAEVVQRAMRYNLPICFVSEELHKRAVDRQWELIKRYSSNSDRLSICTDKPDFCKEYYEYDLNERRVA